MVEKTIVKVGSRMEVITDYENQIKTYIFNDENIGVRKAVCTHTGEKTIEEALKEIILGYAKRHNLNE